MHKRVVITGMGTISPLGNDVATTWSNAVAGRSGAGKITYYDTAQFRVKIAAEVKNFDGAALFGMREARRMDRFTQFGFAAALQAVEEAGLDFNALNKDRMGVIMGTGIGGMKTLYEQVLIFFERGPDRISPFLVPMMLPDSAASMIASSWDCVGRIWPSFRPAPAAPMPWVKLSK